MATVVSQIKLLLSSSFSRTVLTETSSGLKLGNEVSQTNFRLEDSYTLYQKISHFVLIETDAPVLVEIAQVEEVEIDGVLSYVPQTTKLEVSGVFFVNAKVDDLVIRKLANTKRVPRVSVVFA